MTNKESDAFLKSIFGTAPIKKKDYIKKISQTLPNNNKKPNQVKIKISEKNIKNFAKDTAQEKKQSFYKIEKTNLNKKLKKGKIPVDKKIDFHGLSTLDAEDLFSETVITCYRQRLRCLLFVTGKGILKKKEHNESTRLYYGKIRSGFQLWAQKEELKKYILSVESADLEHGADGAFFVYLRKDKS